MVWGQSRQKMQDHILKATKAKKGCWWRASSSRVLANTKLWVQAPIPPPPKKKLYLQSSVGIRLNTLNTIQKTDILLYSIKRRLLTKQTTYDMEEMHKSQHRNIKFDNMTPPNVYNALLTEPKDIKVLLKLFHKIEKKHFQAYSIKSVLYCNW
jgi:hypothetical protein